MATPPTLTYHSTPVVFHGPSTIGKATIHHTSAGSPTSPPLVLLHGFPTSSYQYRDFMPLLADKYQVLAPDLPGFGLTTVPSDFAYTFDNLAAVTAAWLDAVLGERAFALYVFDYGAPVGLRIASQGLAKGKVSAIISQNGNAYEDGFGRDFWAPVFALWESGNGAAERKVLVENVLTLETTRFQYVQGTPTGDLERLNPASWHFDYLQNLSGERAVERQVDLFYDYRRNVGLYPSFQKYFRESGVPILAVWGKGDPAFIPPGAEAYKRDSPGAGVRFVDAGHFALETKRVEVAGIVREWLGGIDF